MTAQREAFERYAKNQGLPLGKWRDMPLEYRDIKTLEAWWSWKAAQAAMPAELAQLRGFAAATMDYWPEDSIDGGELQDIAAANGLLTLEIAHQPCGEVCMCREYVSDAEFIAGVECYRKSQVLLDAEIARNAKEAL